MIKAIEKIGLRGIERNDKIEDRKQNGIERKYHKNKNQNQKREIKWMNGKDSAREGNSFTKDATEG